MTSVSERIGMIHELIPKISAEVKIPKDRRGTDGRRDYQFRGIDDVLNTFHGPLTSHGVYCVPQVEQREQIERQGRNSTLLYTYVRVRYIFYAPDGSSVEAVGAGEAMDSGDKSLNKAMSGAMKNAFFQMFCVPTKDASIDQENEHELAQPQTGSTPQQGPQPRRWTERDQKVRELSLLIERTGTGLQNVLDTFSVGGLSDLTDAQLDRTLEILRQRNQSQDKGQQGQTQS